MNQEAAVSVELDEAGSLSAAKDLASVTIRTHGGDEYAFPAMSKSALGTVLPKGSNRLSEQPLTLVNASTTILMIPLRICKVILVDGEEWWASPA